MPFYEEVARTPFFVWDPRVRLAGERRESLVQPFLDLGPTLLEYFGQKATPDMLGCDLSQLIANDTSLRQSAMFGIHGGHLNITDGRYVYMRAPAGKQNKPLFQYTLMPTHMRESFAVGDFANMTLAEPFSFTKQCKTMKIENQYWTTRDRLFDNMLFDLENDPSQSSPIVDEETVARLTNDMISLMRQCDAPEEQFQRLGLNPG